ncbi:MAG: helix-turn-helix transcriptional regulator [Mycobacteriaceae bacterium]
MSAITDRLPRLLSLVPYLQAHPGVRVEEAAAELGVSALQLRKDLQLLWMCGLPGYGPGELIDLSFEGDTVSVVFDAGLVRPLRLSRAEAGALAVALRALGDVGGLVERDVVERTLAKVAVAAGGSTGTSAVAVGFNREHSGDSSTAETTTTLTAALAEKHPLRIRYYTASRDAVTERVVEPHQLLVVDGRSYLEAWCRRAEDVRMFRVDRIDDVEVLPEVLDTVAEQPPVVHELFEQADELPLAVLELAPRHAWVAEYYPVQEVTPLADGHIRVSLRYTDTEWLLRLVLGLGAGVRVVTPPELGERLTEHARSALAAYARHTP